MPTKKNYDLAMATYEAILSVLKRTDNVSIQKTDEGYSIASDGNYVDTDRLDRGFRTLSNILTSDEEKDRDIKTLWED